MQGRIQPDVTWDVLLELRQPWPMLTPKGRARCLLILDYGADSPSLFLCAIDATGELWYFAQKDVRMEGNQTFGTSATPPA